MAGVLLIDWPHNPELLQAFRQRVLGPRRVRFQSVLRRGVERGDLRAVLALPRWIIRRVVCRCFG